jgi:hypothetical protein
MPPEPVQISRGFGRGEYLRRCAIVFMIGFLSHDWLERSALSPEWRHGIEITIVLIGLIAVLTSTMWRQKGPPPAPPPSIVA